MKNSNYKQQNKQNRKFKKQLSHLSSFIGMPMWNGRNPTLSEIREYDRRLLEQQALGFKPERKRILKLVFGWVFKVLSKAFNQAATTREKTSKKKPQGSSKISDECCA